MTTKRRNTKKKQTYTLSEFKTWLDGYCSAHPSGWSPSAEQWKLISEKLSSIVEEEPEVREQPRFIPPMPVHNPYNPPAQGPIEYPQPWFASNTTSSKSSNKEPDTATLTPRDPTQPMRVKNKEAHETSSDFT